MKRVALIVNPFASKVDDDALAQVRSRLERVAYVRTLPTDRAGHAAELAREAAADADALVVFSGDGGFNEALNGLDDSRVPIGFLPGGGTSVLPRALGLPRDPAAAAERVAAAIEGERTRAISTGRVNGRRFAFSAGIGIDAEAVRRVDALGRDPDGRRPGDLAFVRTLLALVLEHHARLEPMLEVRGRGRAAFVLVSNVDPYTFLKALAIRAAPEVVFEEGLDFLAPTLVTPRELPRLLAYLATGRGRPRALRGHDLDRIEVACDRPLPLQADGEDLGDVTEAVFEAERRSVRVLV